MKMYFTDLLFKAYVPCCDKVFREGKWQMLGTLAQWIVTSSPRWSAFITAIYHEQDSDLRRSIWTAAYPAKWVSKCRKHGCLQNVSRRLSTCMHWRGIFISDFNILELNIITQREKKQRHMQNSEHLELQLETGKGSRIQSASNSGLCAAVRDRKRSMTQSAVSSDLVMNFISLQKGRLYI